MTTAVRSAAPSVRLRRAGVAVLVLHVLFLMSAAALAELYVRGRLAAGSRAALADVAPSALIPFGDHLSNPLAWAYLPVAATALLGVGVGALYAVAGLALSLLTDLRHHRRPARALLATSLLCIAVVVVLAGPVGADLHAWFMPD